jgi:hypothetical protein
VVARCGLTDIASLRILTFRSFARILTAGAAFREIAGGREGRLRTHGLATVANPHSREGGHTSVSRRHHNSGCRWAFRESDLSSPTAFVYF